MIPKRGWVKSGLNTLVLSALLGLLPGTKAALAQTLCAEVRLQIKQEATLEREAFDAALEVTNQYPSLGLTNFRVNVIIKDPQGRTADNSFFIKVSSKEAINAVDGTGIVQPASTATIHWLIIPSTGAGGTNPLGLTYSVKADISYLLNGVQQSISTFEDTIQVKPQPALKLEYVLPFEVFADEALTEAVIEPVEPFPLGVRITNVGYGPARNFQINSGQPEIIENKQNLAIDFKLLGTYVGDKKIPDTLLIPFGDISAGGVSQAAWIMATSLSGRFVKFDASFTHAAELGGQLTSLIQGVTTYTLIKDMLVDLPGRDGQFDFLVNTTTPRGMMQTMLDAGQEIVPDLILESDQAAPIQVVRLASGLTGQLNGANTSATLRLTESAGSNLWIFTSIPAPLDGKAKLVSAVRQDGKNINLKNIWVSRHFNKNNSAVTYRLNLIDYNPPSMAQYTLNFSRESLDAAPAPITDLNAFAVPLGGQTGLNWSATGEDAGSGTILGGRYLIQAATSAMSEFSPTLAQVNFTTNTAPGIMQTYLMKDLAGNASHYLKLWIQDTGGNISTDSNLVEVYVLPNPPAGLAVGAISSDTVAVSWNGGNNNLPVEYGVWADTDAVLPAVAAAPFKDPFDRVFIFEGLTPNTTYLFYGLAKNPVNGIGSEQVYLGQALTLAAEPGQILSSQLFASSFTVVLDAGANNSRTEYFVQLSTMADWSTVTAESGWVAQAGYTFSGLTADTRYYVRAKARNLAGIETAYADLGVLKTLALDILAPVTTISFSLPNFGTGPVYISSFTAISLPVSDDVSLDGDKRGVVAVVYYSVDSTTFSVFSDNFNIVAGGAHLVRYFSVDTAGNIEALKTSTVTVDIVSPAVLVEIAGVVFSTGEVSYIPAASTVTLRASDEASGVKELYYAVNGSTYSIAAGSRSLSLTEGVYTLAYSAADNLGNASRLIISSITADYTPPLSVLEVLDSSQTIDGKFYIRNGSSLTLSASDAFSGVKEIRYSLDGSTAAAASPLMLLVSTGAHVLSFYAIDNVANLELEKIITFFVDDEAPITTSAVVGLMGANGWHISPVTLTLVSTDAMSGIAAASYSLSRDSILISSGAYVSPITAGEDGIYDYSYSSLDKAGNWESKKTGSFKIDISSPALIALSTPAANAAGWNNSAVTAIFSGTDSVSGVEYCTPNVVFEFEGSSMTVQGYCRNYAGLSSTASAMVSIDITAPEVAYEKIPAANASGWNNSPVEVVFSGTDMLSGIASCTSAQTVTVEGGSQTAIGSCSDLAGNITYSTTIIKIDLSTPAVSAVGTPAPNYYGWNNTSVSVVFNGTDTVSGLAYCEPEKTETVEVSSRVITGYCMDFSGLSSTAAYTVSIDTTAPVSTAVVSGVFANGYYSSSVTVTITAFDALSGVSEKECSLDSVTFAPCATSFGIGVDGIHAIAFRSRDLAGNQENEKTISIDIRTVPIVTASINGQVIPDRAVVSITSTDTVTLTAVDAGLDLPVIYYTIDAEFSTATSSKTYTVPFALSAGTHTVYYTALDSAANQAVIKKVFLNIRKVITIQFIPTEKSGGSILWQWELVEGATGYQVISSTGGVLSGFLTSGATQYLQTGLIPNTLYSNLVAAYLPEGVYESGITTAATLAAIPVAPENFVTGQNAEIVIGQIDFVSNLGGYSENLYQFGNPYSVAMDNWGNLWVADYTNARVLRFTPPFINGMSATLVLGRKASGAYPTAPEERLRGPAGVSASRDGALWVADGCRVLQFKPPFYTGMAASLVIGQSGFTNCEYQTTVNRLGWPWHASADRNGSLWVADRQSHRVLRFDPPFANGMNASLVLGQPDFTSGGYSLIPSPNSLFYPAAVTEDEDGAIWISDSMNGRVLKFVPPYTSNMPASLVVGQKDFYSNCFSMGSCIISANVLNRAFGSVFDNSGNLYVADSSGNRVLKFKPPFRNGMAASVVLGQENFTSSSPGLAANKFRSPAGTGTSGSVVIDPTGRLWVADSGNARVLGFNPAGPGAIEAISKNSLAANWLPGANPQSTNYTIELSSDVDFTSEVFAGHVSGMLNYTFNGLSPNTVYNARIKAIGLDGRETNYTGLGAGRTKPSPAVNLRGVAASASSILWTWDAGDKNLSAAVFSSTGGVLSGNLPSGATQYLQSGLSPNKTYGVFVRMSNRSGYTDSDIVEQVTLANAPLPMVPFVSGQPADMVIGQADFNSYSYGASKNHFNSTSGIAFDTDGNLWVADSFNNRVLRFSWPLATGMDADLVIGQTSFTGNTEGGGSTKFSYPTAVSFDSAGNLWVADSRNNRILRFQPPFAGSPASADMVIGQSDFQTTAPGTSQRAIKSPRDVVIDNENNMWVSDQGNSRVLKFASPLSTGMPATVVLGQSSFNYSELYPPASSKTLAVPSKVAFDNTGNLWVSDPIHARVLKFEPPFSDYMDASLVLGQINFNSSGIVYNEPVYPYRISGPSALAVDSEGGIYVGDTNYRRFIRFNPPQANGMNASIALGQNDLYSKLVPSPPTAASMYFPVGAAVNKKDDSIWVLDSARVLRFTPKKTFVPSLSSLAVAWSANSNPASTEYLIRVSTDISGGNSIANSAWQTALNYTFQNLSRSTTYFAFVRTRNSAGAEGLESYIGRAVTLTPPVYIAQSTIPINGVPETVFSASRVPVVSLISSISVTGSIAIGSATSTGLTLASNMYEIGPEGLYDPPATLIFSYSTSTLASLGLLEYDIFVYEFFTSAGWVKLSEQVLDDVNHKITVPITQISSLFGIFGMVKDRTAPISEFLVAGSSWTMTDTGLYINAQSSISLSAFDPVAYSTSSGVAFTEFRIDADTTVSFALYSLPFMLTEGSHTIEYRSRDNAGNLEVAKSTTVYSDSSAPATELLLAGTIGQNGWYVSTATVRLISTDSISGVSGVYYKVMREGELSPSATNYQLYSSPIEFIEEGEYSLYYYAADNTGNVEALKSTAFKLDLTTPTVIYTSVPAPNPDRWNNVPVSVMFTGTDAVSGLAFCSSSFTITSEGMGVPASGYCADYAGWTSTVSFSVNIDTTAPSSNAEIAAAHGLSGWLLTPAEITLTSTDSLSGIVGLYYSVDGSSFSLYSSSFAVSGEGAHSLKYYSVDRAGNKEAERELAFKLDLNSPIVSAVPGPAANPYGWNNTAVSVVFSGTDTMSGLAYCEPEKIVETEGSSRTVTGYCSDYAGRSSTATLTINIDTTAPNLSYTPEPLANQLGWNNSDVALKFTCSDSLSGVKSCPADILFSSEGVNISTTGAVYDYAGNSGDILVSGIKIDRTAPISTAMVSGVYKNGWYSSPVTVVLVSTDSLSGLKGIVYSLDGGWYSEYTQPVVVSSEGNHVLIYYSEDLAGNTESARTIAFAIDATAPIVDYLLNPPANPIGWNSSPVNVLFRGSDTLSGIVDCSSVTVAGEGKGQELIGWCRDLAGNIAYATATLNIDLTRPLVSADQAPASNASGWNNSPVEINFTGADALSGIAYCEPVKTVSAAGAGQTVTGYCADYAGLTSTATLIVNIDTTAPSLSYAPEPAANLMGWNNSDVLLKFTCADGLSGVKACPADIMLAGEGVNISTSAAAFDLAGNIRYTTATLNIDRTPPAITISSPAAGQVFIATRGDIGVKFGVMDNLDPAPPFRSYLEQVEDRGSPRGARPARLAVSDGQAIEPLGIDDGIWRLAVSATDFADNAALLSGGTFEVIHDVLAPRTGHSLTAGPSLVVGATTYIASGARLELTSIDDLVSANDGIGLGVKDQSIRVKSGGFLVKELLFANPAPKQGEAFTSSFTGAGLGLADGIYGLSYNASDVLGNIETEKSVLIGLDNTAPASSAGLTGMAGGNGWHISTVTISLLATDALSGVAGISYGLDDNDYVSYTSPVETATEGQRTVRFYARDRLGNTEAGKSVDFKIDRTPPIVISTITPAANAAGWHNGTVKAGFSGSDAVSGIAYCEPAGTMRAEGRGLELSGYCRDQAGLTSTATARFNIDLTSPTAIIERVPLANLRGWNNTDVKITFTCADALSGIKSCPSAVTLAMEGAGQGAGGTVADYADNISSASMGGINIDKTTPAGSLSISGVLWESGSDKYLNPRSAIVLAATDGLSGVEAMEYHVDEAPFGAYSSSFSLAEGLRTVHYRAIDKADNIEATRTALYRVDGTGPATFLKAVGGSRYLGPEPGSFYASLASRFTLEAADPVTNGVASGVRLTSWSDNGSAASNTTESPAFAEGRHVLAYWSMDNVDNQEVAKSTTILVDDTAPVTTHHIGSPYYAAGGVNYITPATPLTFTAGDPVSREVASGVSKIEVSLNGSPFDAYSSALKFAEGRHTIKYRAVDNVGNVEAEKTLEVQSDNTVPVSGFVSSGQYYGSLGRLFAPLRFTYSLTAADPVVDNVASGVKFSEYRIDGGAFTVYSSTFGLTEGIRSVEYRSHDNVTNMEPLKSATVYVDNTVPKTALRIAGGAQYVGPEPGSFYASLASRFTLEAADPVTNSVASGVRQTFWSDNGGAISYAIEGLAFAEGRHVLAYWSMDNVDNQEVTKSTTILVDNTAPVTTHHIGSPYYVVDGVNYITPATPLTFTAVDPVSGEVASGVSRIEVSLDGSLFGAYSSALKFNEGRHTIKYRAIDKVGNVEAERILEVQSDNTAPISNWSAASGDRIERGSKFYLNAIGRIALGSVDPGISDVAAGVEGIYYGIDAVPTEKYAAPFGLAEGMRTIKFSAKDNVENMEVVKSTVIYVDGTKPVTQLSLSGDQYKGDGQYISRRTDIVIAATDPVVNDISVGVKETKYTVDGGSYNDYSQFKLSAEGKRLVSFYSADHVNNVEVAKAAELWVDGTAPLSVLDVLGGKQYPGAEPGSFYASLATKFGFVSVDPLVSDGAAGVKVIEYADNNGISAIYSQPISLGEGKHSITYRATDQVENTEVFRSTQIYIDNTAPVTSFNIAGPLYFKDGIRHITPESGVTFASTDPLISEVSAGVERIETAVDGGAYVLYTAALKFPEGRHTIKYRAYDNVGNLEAANTLEVQSDATAPESRWLSASGPWIEKDNKFYLNALGSIALESADPVRNNVASGLENIYYGIDAAPAVKYLTALSLAEGVRIINYSAKDNVANTEVVKSTVIYVDGTKPATTLSLSGDQYNGGKQYISQRTDIVITAADPAVNNVAVGVKDTKYSVDGAAFVNYSLFKLSAEGKRLVSYYSTDFVSNIETAKTTALWVDNTPPSTELSIAGALYTTPGDEKLYITKDSGIVLTSSDPVSNDTASGVMLTKYRIDNGNWQVYTGSFTIAAEGLHTLEYYALDRVQNAEALKSAKIAVDNTPPVTGISLGEPKSEVFGLPVIMQNTPITLTAADPVVNTIASGLNSIFYELENVQTGVRAPVAAYTSPFTIPEQGTFIIRYWSKDNTGNTETPKEKMAAVTTWRVDGLIAASGLDMSGTADISGSVKSNAAVSLGGTARILGDVTASTITLTGKAQITGLQINGATPVNPAPIYMAGIVQNAAAVNSNTLVAAYLVDGKLVVSSKVNLTLSTGTYYFKGMDLSGGSSITITGKVDILVEGGVTINGGSSMNASGEASRLAIIVSTASELKFNGGGALAACVYAPYSDLKLTGNSLLGGHYFVKTAAVSGTGNLLQSGEALPVAAAPTGGGPKTKAAAMPGSRVGVLAGPDPEFKLGEVYVFPNPAKGMEAPVFHIEVGIADSVKITIYTISGRAAHEHTLTGLPVELDDGNGLSYAYEYTWRGHIPSGVYLYAIEARKAGQTLKKTGKFGVVR